MSRYLIVSRYDWTQDRGTSVTGSGWTDLGNVLIPRPQQAAIATGASASLVLNLGAVRSIGLIHLQNLVTSAAAQLQISAGSYNSGLVNAWATDAHGTYPPLEWAALGRPRFFVLPAPVLIDMITININGGAQALGYVGACEIWQAPVNMSYDWSITSKDLANVDRVPFGSTYVTKRGKVRQLNMGVDFLRQDGIYGNGVGDEVFSQPLALALINGKSCPIAAVPFPDDTANLERTSVAGYSIIDQQFSNPFFAAWKTTFQIDQFI